MSRTYKDAPSRIKIARAGFFVHQHEKIGYEYKSRIPAILDGNVLPRKTFCRTYDAVALRGYLEFLQGSFVAYDVRNLNDEPYGQLRSLAIAYGKSRNGFCCNNDVIVEPYALETLYSYADHCTAGEDVEPVFGTLSNTYVDKDGNYAPCHPVVDPREELFHFYRHNCSVKGANVCSHGGKKTNHHRARNRDTFKLIAKTYNSFGEIDLDKSGSVEYDEYNYCYY